MGDEKHPKYRSSSAARKLARNKQDDLFAATQLFEVMKLLPSSLATGNEGERLMVTDVKRAYFYARSKRLTCVQPPPEDIGSGEENMCGRLHDSTYGTRDAAANWSEECTQRSVDMGFEARNASPCIFHLKERGLQACIH